MLDLPLMLRVKLPAVETIHPKETSLLRVWRRTGDSKLNDSPGTGTGLYSLRRSYSAANQGHLPNKNQTTFQTEIKELQWQLFNPISF